MNENGQQRSIEQEISEIKLKINEASDRVSSGVQVNLGILENDIKNLTDRLQSELIHMEENKRGNLLNELNEIADNLLNLEEKFKLLEPHTHKTEFSDNKDQNE